MFQAPDGTSNMFDTGAVAAAASISDYQYPPRSAPNYASQGDQNVSESDGSEQIFSMYWEMVGEEDKKMVEGWKADADRILTFTGLFSSAVTTLIAVSIQDIQLNPQDTSNFYLSNIYQVLSDPTRANVSLPLSPPPFSPPRYAVWVNTFWFLSLVISLTCALLASLVQQWARRYLRATQRHYRPHKRARIRAFFAEGMEKFHLPWAFDVLPMLLHISLFLFFAGLVVFLWRVDQTLFKLVLSLVGVCLALYGIITIMPFYHHDCPYYTPLTSPAWSIVIGTPYVIVRVLRWSTSLMPFSFEAYNRFWALEKRYHNMLSHRVLKTAEETALNSPSEIDTRIFMWTFDTLNEDHELERFFSGFLGFRSSNVVSDPLALLTEQGRLPIFEALFGLLDRTFSSDSLPQSVKNRRAIICAKAFEPPVEIPYQQILDKIVSENQYRGLKTAEFGSLVKGWDIGGNQGTVLVVQAIVAGIVATAQRRDDSWFTLASDALRVPESVLRDYATRGNDLSLVILLYLIRQQFGTIRDWSSPQYALSTILGQASKFDVQVTSPELKHAFCTLWNEMVLEAQTDDQNLYHKLMAWNILRQIRSIYVFLHQDNDSVPARFLASASDQDRLLSRPSSYPSCNVSGHYLDATLHIHDIETSASVHPTPRASTSPPSAIFVQPTADCRTPSGESDVPLSPSPTPGKTLSQDILLTGSHSSVLSPPASGPSLLQISAPNLGTASNGEGSATDALHKEDEPPLPTGEITVATPDLLSQSSSSPSIINPAIASPSQRSPDNEHTGNQPPYPSV